MQVTFYSNFKKKKNSLKVPSDGTTLSVQLKNNTSLYQPTFILNKQNINFNYCSCNGLYYYINDVTMIGNIFHYSCTLDEMASARNDILVTSQYVLRSSSVYNLELSDNAIPVYSVPSVTQVIGSTLFDADANSGYYVLYAKSSQVNPYVGCGAWFMDYSLLSSIIRNLVLTSNGVDGIDDQIIMYLNNGTMDSILKVVYIPSKRPSQTFNSKVVIGTRDMNISAQISNPKIEKTQTLQIPWSSWDKYTKNSNQYSVMLDIPFIGSVSFSIEELANSNAITIYSLLDAYSGDLFVEINPISGVKKTYQCSIGIEQLWSATGFKGTIASSILGGVGGASAGMVGGVVGAIAGAVGGAVMGSVAPLSTETKTIGGYNSTCAVDYQKTKSVKMFVYKRNPSTSSNNLLQSQGGMLCEVKALNTLSGYCQCYNASIETNLPDIYKDNINNIMNSGFFIE